MVRLKDAAPYSSLPFIRCFNSTMVRLKVAEFAIIHLFSRRFQFHNGSIKRDTQRRRSLHIRKFQFHNGSIKRRTVKSPANLDFVFQFHNGSIKSLNVLSVPLLRSRFQFHNGSIKSGVPVPVLGRDSRVSIPQWFD